ncbi:MAG: LysM peptidoglycan-binding domain-containing protein [Opitutaceae bacterium]|nr:LysM peptidoglycan-binding domain-containing protein [Opitutaceae bacterium]
MAAAKAEANEALAKAQAARPSPAADSSAAAQAKADAELKKQLDDTATKLEASVRAFALLQGEHEELKSAVKSRTDESAGLRDKISALEQQLAASRADLAAKSSALETASKLDVPAESETAAKLATVLRSYSLAQADIDALRASSEKLAAEKAALEQQLVLAKNAIPVATQAQGLREQLRQTQAQLATLAEENARLKTQLASNIAARTVPARPMAVATTATSSAVPAKPAANAPTMRSHTIAPGDTLTRISVFYYSTPNRWTDIYAANRDVLRDERSLVVGRILRIP